MYLDDFKYAVRLLFKRPGFSVLTILVMAAGIGLSLFMFSFMHTALFKHLPFEDGTTLVQMAGSINGSKASASINPHDLYEIKENVRGLKEFSIYRDTSVNVSMRDGARRFVASEIEANLFSLTRNKPVLGRELAAEENQPGAEKVAVIGFDIWQNQYAGSETVLDETLRINGDAYRIVGVMPEGYYFPKVTEIWIPRQDSVNTVSRNMAVGARAFAHLDGSASIKEVNKQLLSIMKRIEERYPEKNSGLGAYIGYLPGMMLGDGSPVVDAMRLAAFLILVLAAINVANLLFSRAVERNKETAIRVALGAPRSRLISQLLWESTIICVLGGLIAILFVGWSLEATEALTATFFDDGPAFWFKFGVDAYTLKLFAIFVVGSILITGLLPAWKNSGGDFNSVLRDGTRGALGKKSGRLNRLLVIGEIFISIPILVVAAIILVATYITTHASYADKPETILVADIKLNENRYDTMGKQTEFYKTLVSRLKNSNGVGDVYLSTAYPGNYAYQPKLAVEGREYSSGTESSFPRANFINISENALQRFGVELVSGRYFNVSDIGAGRNTIIVTDSFVERHFNGEEAIGKRVRVVSSENDELNWLTVVGVVKHTKQGPGNEPVSKVASVFRHYSQAPIQHITIGMDMKADRTIALASLRNTLAAMDPDLPAFRIEVFSENLARLAGPVKFMSKIFILIGIAAIALTISGIYGVMSNTISQRTQEIGVKRALGAPDQLVIRQFLASGFKQFLWGGVPGVIIGYLLGSSMAVEMGVGLPALTVIAILLVILIGTVVILASYYPTSRALELEPSDALRYE